MHIWILFLAFFAILPNHSSAMETYGYFFGGGGDDPKQSQTDAFIELQEFHKVASTKKWHSTYIHNGGHQKDDEWLKKNINQEKKRFEKKEFEKTITEIKKKISDKKITSKDQVIIYIATHGQKRKGKEIGHNILSIDGGANTAVLKSLKEAAAAENIPFAIVDASCYSGATLALADNKTCVITAAAEDIAYKGDSFQLLGKLGNSKNLEQAFIEARAEHNYSLPGQPQISTLAGTKAQKMLDLFKIDLSNMNRFVANESSLKCSGQKTNIDDFKNLLSKISENGISLPAEEVTKYKTALKTYREQEALIIKKVEEFKNAEECFVLNSGYKSCYKLSEIDFAIDYHKAEIASQKDPSGISKEMLNKFATLKNNNRFKSYKSRLQTIKKMASDSWEKSKEISKIERGLYNKLYHFYSKNSGENPCSNFKL